MREETQRLKKEREAIEREKAELMALTRRGGNIYANLTSSAAA